MAWRPSLLFAMRYVVFSGLLCAACSDSAPGDSAAPTADTSSDVILPNVEPPRGPATAEATEGTIQSIRERHASIQENLEKYETIQVRVEGFAVEGSEITVLFDGRNTVKIDVSHYAEAGFAQVEYFFWEGDLFFAFQSIANASQWNPDGQGQRESRFYFHDGRLIRWIDPAGAMTPMSSVSAQKRSRSVTEQVAQTIAAFEEALQYPAESRLIWSGGSTPPSFVRPESDANPPPQR